MTKKAREHLYLLFKKELKSSLRFLRKIKNRPFMGINALVEIQTIDTDTGQVGSEVTTPLEYTQCKPGLVNIYNVLAEHNQERLTERLRKDFPVFDVWSSLTKRYKKG